MKKIITFLCSYILFVLLGTINISAQEIGADAMHIFSSKNGYKIIPINKDTQIEFITSEPLTPEFELRTAYHNLNFADATGSGGITGHMDRGLGGIMMLSNNTSNDVSLYMGGSDPWHFDKQLDYYGKDYIRSSWMWNLFYNKVINEANKVITMIEEESLMDEFKASLGQALALRAISYFYLAQFYQNTYITSKESPCVPLILTSSENSIYSRATVSQVYEQIVDDLCEAIRLLDGWERDSMHQIDKQVAQGILARVYLVMHQWGKAIEMARAAREGYPLMDAQTAYYYNYQDVTNSEVMWGVDITTSTSMIYASFQSWMCTQYYGYGGQVGAFQLIDAKLYNSIPENDVRKYLYVAPGETYPCESWEIPAYGNLKFKIEGAEDFLGDVIYMRSSEMYLTEIEALVCLGKTNEANQLLQEFAYSRILEGRWNGRATIEEVQKQRRIELWGEGFSYFDHRRWQLDMNRGYEGTNEPEGSWPKHFEKGFVPWWHYSWRYQLPNKAFNEHLTEADQNPIGEEGNQNPNIDQIEIFDIHHFIEFDIESFTATPQEDSLIVKLRTNRDYKITTPEWIRLSEKQSNAITTEFHFVVEENTTSSTRTGDIIATCNDNCGKSDKVTVIQKPDVSKATMTKYTGKLTSLLYGDEYDTTIGLVWDENDPTMVTICNLDPYFADNGLTVENNANFVTGVYFPEENVIGVPFQSTLNISVNNPEYGLMEFSVGALNTATLEDNSNYNHLYLYLNEDKSTITFPTAICTLVSIGGEFAGHYDIYGGGVTFTKVDRTVAQKAPTKKNVEAIAQKTPTKKFVQILPQKIPMIKDVQTIVQQGLKKKLNQSTPQKVSSKKSLIQDTPFDITNISKV